MDNNIKEVEYFPSKPVTVISEVVYYNILLRVPKGRIIRYKDLDEQVEKIYNCEFVKFDHTIYRDEYMSWLGKAYVYAPRWRVVGDRAMMSADDYQREKLSKEGITFKSCGKTGKMVQIVNYKDLLFVPLKELNMTKEELESFDDYSKFTW